MCCDAELAPLHKAVSGQAIADEYIVLMKPDMLHEECTCLIFAFVFVPFEKAKPCSFFFLFY
jgi:hypothetical protein